jgi:hypothetical protein
MLARRGIRALNGPHRIAQHLHSKDVPTEAGAKVLADLDAKGQ